MLNIAIAGFGWWGRHILTRLQGHDRLSVLAVAEPDQSLHADIRAMGAEAVSGFDGVLSDPRVQAVVLTTPHMMHEEQVVAAARAGKHVFCEKPLAMTAASARCAVLACREAGVVLGIGHELRFDPAMRRLKALVSAGDLGTIMHAEAAFSHNKLAGLPGDGWRTSKTMSPGAGMTGMGIHLTDLMIWLFGPVETVQAQVRDRTLGWPTGDMVVAQLGFAAGNTAHFQAILNTTHYMRCAVFGADGWAEARYSSHPDTPGGQIEWSLCRKGGAPEREVLDWSDAVVSNLTAFAQAVTGRHDYPWSDAELIGNIAVYEAIVQSSDSGETVRLG